VDGQTADGLDTRLGGLGAKAVAAEEYVNSGSAADWRMVRLTFIMLIAMSVGYTAIAIANSLMMATPAAAPAGNVEPRGTARRFAADAAPCGVGIRRFSVR